MKTLLLGVIYPGLKDALIVDYVQSIVAQQDKDFDWLMINDNAGQGQVHLFPPQVKWLSVDTPMSFGKIRELGIHEAKKNKYDAIIFSDVDDYYSSNRVGITKAQLEHHDFIFTELQVVSYEKVLTHRNLIQNLKANQSPSVIEDIIDYNYIGLSHSAVRVSALCDFVIPKDVEVVDWWIFSILLLSGYRGNFIPGVDTFYRQNSENYVGVYNLLDASRLKRGIEVKLNHYDGLKEFCQLRGMGKMVEVFQARYQQMIKLQEAIENPSFLIKYISVVNKNFNQLYRGWWSEILPLGQWERYEE